MSVTHRPADRRSVALALVRRMTAERRRLISGFTVAAAALAAMTAALYASIGVDYASMVEELPAAFDSMLGGADFSTAAGFLQVELFSIVAPGLVLGVAIAVGSGSLAGAEQGGRLALITTGPVKRSTVTGAALATMVVAVVAVSMGLFVGVEIGASAGGVDLATSRLAAACVSVGLFGVAVGAISLAAGAFSGSRSIALASGTAVAVGSYVIDAFFPLNGVLEPFAEVSLWHPYAANTPLTNGLDPRHVAIFLVVTAAASFFGLWGFERRDLAG